MRIVSVNTWVILVGLGTVALLVFAALDGLDVAGIWSSDWEGTSEVLHSWTDASR